MGADQALIGTESEFDQIVKTLTNGRGVDVVFDSVGRNTFDRSLLSLAPLGHLVSYGQSSGPVSPFDILRLGQGSLSVIRPRLGDYITDRATFESRSNDIFSMLGDEKLKVTIHQTFPLEDAAKAHMALESRGTRGKLLLVP